MALLRTPPLEERVKNIRADLDAWIDARVAAIKKDCPGVPDGAIRNMLVRTGCQCASYLEIKAKDDAAKEKAA